MTGPARRNASFVLENLSAAPCPRCWRAATCTTRISTACRSPWAGGAAPPPPDLRVATAFVLPLGGKGQDEVLGLLARNKAELRRLVAKKLTLKFSPELRFRLDETFDRMDDTRRMFDQAAVRRDLDQ